MRDIFILSGRDPADLAVPRQPAAKISPAGCVSDPRRFSLRQGYSHGQAGSRDSTKIA
jgi:hypothetical protein